jgi:hypothetical protein
MPKQRPPFDTQRYESLKARGLSNRAIAKEMQMPEATLRNNLKVMEQAIVEGIRQGDLGIPSVDTAEASPTGLPEGDTSTPALYVHPGIPDNGAESPVGSEAIEGVHEGIPALPLAGRHEGDQGGPSGILSPHLAEALTEAWPDLQQLLAWWRARQQQAQEPTEKLERATYHVAPRWIEAVRREADLTGGSYASVVNRAFATYFTQAGPRAAGGWKGNS